LLHDHHTLRLVVLNSCEGAMQDVNDPFSSIATTLMLAGIPAVIAMQFEISDQAAITFAKIFYKWLAKGTAIDKAVGEARKYLFAVERNNVEWGTPVLYLRAKDGELFALDSKVPEQEKAIQEKLAKEKLEQEKRLEQERLAQEQTVQIKKTRQEIIELPNNVISEMIYIPAGEFLMGSAQGEEGTGSDEYPQHKVTVPAFYMAKYPVTQAQYQAVMGENPSHFKGNDHPVESVSWNDAKTFCQKLSALTGAAYRLPSEAEWEYACRAGTTTKWWFGDNEAELEKYAWYDKNAGVKFLFFGGQTSPVGQKPANPYGLYDMHGNVWEWCEDVWHGNYNGAPNDATAWISGGDQSLRVIRGGSWSYDPVWLRSAYRYNFTPDSRSGDLGFRLSRM
jgi:formylglycine-generating enzyme required for sulfatase activity